MTIMGLLAMIGAFVGVALLPPPNRRGFEQILNRLWQNQLLAIDDLSELMLRGKISEAEYQSELAKMGLDKRKAGQLLSLKKRIISISDLALLRVRRKIDPAFFLSEAKKQGFDKNRANLIFSLTQQRLDPNTVIRAIWRGVIFRGGKEGMIAELKEQGFTQEQIETIEKTMRFYPTPDDFIRFMVRETFDERVVEKYGYDVDYPPMIDEFVQKAGVEPFWMRHFWRAHWILPSPTMGYEMLHRGVIGRTELEDLLRIADYPSYWRDKLIKISYVPYTRVDIRRMHKMGVLTDADLVRAYMDIGYDEEKAKKMADFTIKYNVEVEETEEDTRKREFKGLTTSAILTKFKQDQITEEQARDYLTKLEFTPEVIDFYISKTLYDKRDEELENQLRALRLLYINRIIDPFKVQSEIDKLNLPAKQKENLLFLWEIERTIRLEKPTKGDLLRFLLEGVINVEEFVEEMKALGYNEKYIAWYLNDVSIKIERKELKVIKVKK